MTSIGLDSNMGNEKQYINEIARSRFIELMIQNVWMEFVER